MNITLPELSLVILIGPSGAGKSTFARTHFKPTEVVSSDVCRGLVSDDETDQTSTADAFAVLNTIVSKRLARGKLTVVDATNVQAESRRSLLAIAKEFHVIPVALIFDLPTSLCLERNKARPNRSHSARYVRSQQNELRRGLGGLRLEGFRHIHRFASAEAVDGATIRRDPLPNNLRTEHGPFDLIGDVHGCLDELNALLDTLGYVPTDVDGNATRRHPDGRRAVFLGDLVDRGPGIVGVLRLAMAMVASGDALCVPGNHEMKLLRKLRGKDVKVTHGLAETLSQLDAETPAFRESLVSFLDALVSHYLLDDGKLVVAHAGMKEPMQGRNSGKVREFALYGESSGETDEYGMPIRYPWAEGYRGKAMVVYGHTPVPEPEWLNNTLCIDTGCVYGGKLTALRYPELAFVSVPAAKVYCEPTRPLRPTVETSLSAQQQHDTLLDLADVAGRRYLSPRLLRTITLREENTTAALEAMSRFAVDPRWLIYLPPTMSPTETSTLEGFLEHPAEAFSYFAKEGVTEVICEEKHMGSRAVIVVCRDASVAQSRFGVEPTRVGVIYTRTGRPFFGNNPAIETALLDRLRAAITAANLWSDLSTDWLCLDCELMPWSLKAQELLRDQYAAVATAAETALGDTVSVLRQAQSNGADVGAILGRHEARAKAVGQYRAAYRQYCWPVDSIDDIKLAPFHLLASEGNVYVERDHRWHMDTLAKLAAVDAKLFIATRYRVVSLADTEAVDAATAWWCEMTAAGGEGMVVKPLSFLAAGRKGPAQPAIKCRGAEYLRIIYGPEYDLPGNLDRLRTRGVSTKRSMAMREFVLGVESLERFVRREPLRRVHECVFAVLALESEPVDPRL